jgi:hypothetical protein
MASQMKGDASSDGRTGDSRVGRQALTRLVACGVIGAVWCASSVLVLLGLMARIQNQGASINRVAFYSGTVLASSVVWLGMAGGYLLRRRLSLALSVAGGVAVGLAFTAVGYGLLVLGLL